MYSNRVGLYHEDRRVGELEMYPPKEPDQQGDVMMKQKKKKQRDVMEEMKKAGIRISRFSQSSERCPPLAVLTTISTSGLCFKLEASTVQDQLGLFYSSCLRDNKTAVMLLGEEELHLVAMYSKDIKNERPCFWAFSVAPGIYDSSLVMLNLRCLGIVFDLDETLVVAHTSRTFEERIEGLQRRINNEVDPQRCAAMAAEMKRFQDDKILLKQYIENDQIIENGEVIKVQSEIVPALSDNHQPIVRPLIRLPEKNLVLTRINPMIRDTSVLVRLRSSWEELRSYLIAKGRKRFEVYVCTMAERDYALEMWRLLDPEGNLISANDLLTRIVCVKSGFKKSLFNVFSDGTCHPKMSLIIDDRQKVWEEKDQPRVHVVPAFAPYYSPQEAAATPVLCVARNVACGVRGGFFRDFDDSLLQRIGEISYENDAEDIPSPPDVSHYLVPEDDTSGSNGNKDPLPFDGMPDAEVERRLKEALSVSSAVLAATNIDPRIAAPVQYPMASASSVSVPVSVVQQPPQPSTMAFPSVQFQQPSIATQMVPSEPSLQNSPAREEGEVPESELDPDTRRRLLILQHGQDTRDPSPSKPTFPQRPPVQAPPPHVQPRSGWFPAEEEMDPAQLRRPIPKEYPLDSEMMHTDKHRPRRQSFFSKIDNATQSDRMLHENRTLPKESLRRDEQLRSDNNVPGSHPFYGEETSWNQSSSRNSDLDFTPGRSLPLTEAPPAEILHEIAIKSGSKVEYKPGLVASTDLRFSVEAWLCGEKIGEGTGKSRREALHKAAEVSIRNLADVYMSRMNGAPGASHRDASPFTNGNLTTGNATTFGNQTLGRDETAMPVPSRPTDPRLEGSVRPVGSITALRELCASEGFEMAFQNHFPPPSEMVHRDELHAQVEIDGRIFGEGVGSTWDEARMQAADKALFSVRSMLSQPSHKRQGSPRSFGGMSNKRLKPVFQRSMQRMPSSGRYS